ncbi:hypothetical protein PISL3812_04360 [Talaromyces islandicus]|uniref:Uncharacterized protein n=1 Tax=Talaromyces islandicus TaxID=28573 RepID=A0A0U1LVB6_TALIS|nr:hypothetical protein PISL3812_04360 [Talaromyces islandicus]
MTCKVPPPSLKMLSKATKNGLSDVETSGARHIDRERIHQYACGHSVEKNNCMFPPSHRESAIRVNARNSDLVLYGVRCNFCEEKEVVSWIIMNSLKERIRVMTGGILRMKETEGPDPVEVTWSSESGKRRMIAITFWYPKKGSENGYEEIKVTAYPARKLDGERSHKWEDVHVDMTFESQVVSMQLKVDIRDQLNVFEENWNEFKYPSQPILSTIDLSSNSSHESVEDLFDPVESVGPSSLFQE